MPNISKTLSELRTNIEAAATRHGRPADAVTLLAVSKRQSTDAMRDACAAGQRDFGENYVQEALDKREALADLDLVWHFIGPIQSNKTRDIANAFDWVHSVDRAKIAERLSAQRGAALTPLNICVQVNLSNEDSKSGVPLTEAESSVRSSQASPTSLLEASWRFPRRSIVLPSSAHAMRRCAKNSSACAK